MDNVFQSAFDQLVALGVTVYEGDYYGNENGFRISGEDGDADYYMGGAAGYDDFGVKRTVNAVLEHNGLFAEWINSGVLGVYKA